MAEEHVKNAAASDALHGVPRDTQGAPGMLPADNTAWRSQSSMENA
jgi:hypothetical protein